MCAKMKPERTKGGVIMEDFLAQLKDILAKIVEFIKGLLAKITGKEEDESEA